MLTNQHRWRNWLADKPRICSVLDEGIETLKWAWGIDREYPESFPYNVGIAFHDIKQQIRRIRGLKDKIPEQLPILGALRQPPKCFGDLLYESTIKIVYENQNANTYEEALSKAAKGDASTFHKIIRVIEKCYLMDTLDVDAAPRPRVEFFLKSLFEIADLSGVNEMEDEGIVEFIQDLCPCDKVHGIGAVSKYRKRRLKSAKSTG